MSSPKLIPFASLAPKGIPFSKVTVWRLERQGRFPKRIALSAQRVAWIESEIDDWLADRIAARRPVAA